MRSGSSSYLLSFEDDPAVRKSDRQKLFSSFFQVAADVGNSHKSLSVLHYLDISPQRKRYHIRPAAFGHGSGRPTEGGWFT
jgi:hypothetical protein